MEEQRGKRKNMNRSNLNMISLGERQTDNIYLMITLSKIKQTNTLGKKSDLGLISREKFSSY